jgi:hypothetical protein
MKNKNHGDGQDDENIFLQIIIMAVTALTIIAVVIEIATWFVK